MLDQIPEGGDQTQEHTPSDADQSPHSSEGDEEQQQDADGTGLVEENIKKEDNNNKTISLSPGTTEKMRKWSELAQAQEALLESQKPPEASSSSSSGLPPSVLASQNEQVAIKQPTEQPKTTSDPIIPA